MANYPQAHYSSIPGKNPVGNQRLTRDSLKRWHIISTRLTEIPGWVSI